MSMTEKLLREFDEEYGNTRKFLALIPDDKLMWKPHEKSMELGRLAWHLTDFPEWTILTFTQENYEMTAEDAERAMHGWRHKIREDMLARFDGDLPVARAVLENVTDTALAKT